MPENYDEQIRTLRRARGLSQGQLATLVIPCGLCLTSCYQVKSHGESCEPRSWKNVSTGLPILWEPKTSSGAWGGTGAGAADQGRDLECVFYVADPAGGIFPEKWWIEVKARNKTVEPKAVRDAVLGARAPDQRLRRRALWIGTAR